jgi:type II secretory pathway pseudopilin PulG
MVVVVLIIAVSSAIAIPAVQAGMHQREVRQTLQQFVAAVRDASSKAILRRRSVELWIAPDEGSYALAMPLDKPPEENDDRRSAVRRGDPYQDAEQDEGRTVIGKAKLPESASFGEIKGGRYLEKGSVVAFPFFPTGGSGGGEIELVFERGSSKQSYVIAIDPLISEIALKDEAS